MSTEKLLQITMRWLCAALCA